MKFQKLMLLLNVGLELGLSCTKEANSVKQIPISACTVVNAVINANPIIVDFTGTDSVSAYYSTTQQIEYGSFHEFSIPAGNTPIVIYQTTDTIHPMFKTITNLKPNAIYSLFLSASNDNQKSIDTLLTQDSMLYHSATDSTIGVRFVNLSPGSHPMSINIQGNTNGSEVASLAYRSITSFKSHSATINIPQYIFEIRDAVSGSILETGTFNISLFQNVTIVINGINGGTDNNALGVFLVNSY